MKGIFKFEICKRSWNGVFKGSSQYKTTLDWLVKPQLTCWKIVFWTIIYQRIKAKTFCWKKELTLTFFFIHWNNWNQICPKIPPPAPHPLCLHFWKKVENGWKKVFRPAFGRTQKLVEIKNSCAKLSCCCCCCSAFKLGLIQ